MRFRNVLVAACLTAAAFVSVMLERLDAQGSTDIVISEFRFRGPNGINDEFIELFNSSAEPIAVGLWQIRASNNSGASATRATIPSGVTIGPGCFYLIVNNTTTTTAPGYSGGVRGNLTYAIGFAENGGVAVQRADLSIADQVGHTTGVVFGEGTRLPVETTNTNHGIERRPGGSSGHADTDNNDADFREIATANPQNASSACLTSSNPRVTGSASPSSVEEDQIVTLFARVTPGSVPPSTGLHVTGNLSAIGGAAAATFADDGVFPDLTANDTVFTTALTVPAGSALGSQSLALTVTDAQGRSGNTLLSLTINQPAVVYLPHDIQGSGAASPFPTGTAVIVKGVVTATKKRNGFFLQTAPDMEDADPETSEGLFVFVSGAAPPEAVVGHLALVRGSVAEFVPSADPGSAPLTELNLVTAVTDLGEATMPAPYLLTGTEVSPTGTPDQLERFEGMRVTVASLTAITGTGGVRSEANASSTSDGAFYAVLTGQSRPFREPGVEAGDPVLPCRIAPCRVPLFDGNPERLRVDSDDLDRTVAVDVSTGAVMRGVTGPLDFGFRTYTLLPEAPLAPAGGMTIMVAPPVPDLFTIASFNLHRFFDTVDDAGGDVALAPAAYQRRLTKASLAIRTVLNSPDIIGLQEVENLSVLNDLSTRLNLDAAVANRAPPGYALYLVEGPDPDGLDVAFLVKSGRVDVTSVEQVGAADTFDDPNDDTVDLVNDRPPLVLRAIIQGPAGSPSQSVTVIVNHLQPLTDVALDSGTGARVRAQRRAQAEFLANYIQGRQLNDPNEAIVSIGTYNAFSFNDGYVDVMGTILGTPALEDRVTISSPDLVEPDLTDLASLIEPAQRYSYSFRGNAQTLDRVIVTADLVEQFAALIYPRVNVDFPEVLRGDPTTPSRVSDHDPAVAYFFFPPDAQPPVFSFQPQNREVEATSAAGASVTYDAPTAADDVDGNVEVVCKPASGATLPLGNTGVRCTAADAAGNVAPVSFTVSVIDTTAPQLSVLTPIKAEADSAAGTSVAFIVSATDTVTARPVVTCTPASGATFAIGVTTVACNASDLARNSATGSFTVTVADTTAPDLVLPADYTAEAGSAAGQVVSFTASATDAVTDPPLVTCAPVSGEMFPIGVTTVHCTASDAAGQSTTDSFTVTVADTTAPLLQVPAAITAEAGSTAGQVVSFTASATDAVTDPPLVTCAPVSGETFPIGVTTVHCTASDAAGQSTTDSFTVTVADTMAPLLHVPAAITAEAGSSAGQVVSFTASATDAVTDPPLVTCAPASGEMFPIGVTTVHCTASDAAGHSTADWFTVAVADTTAPLLHVPAAITAEAGSAAGLVVTYTPSATDAVAAAPVITCMPASGTTFPIGTTTVTCNATDARNSAGGTFTVTVADTTAPQLVLPADITAPASSTASRVVNFTVSATDAVTASPVVTCDAPALNTFPIGVTIVQCSASDAAGNSASDSFAVTITATIAGRLHGAGSVGSNAAKVSFRLDVRASAASGDSGLLVVKIGVNNFSAGVSTVTFASALRQGSTDSVTFIGSGSWNGLSGYSYQAVAADYGEPGRGRDTFSVVVRAPDGTPVASGAGTLTTGNIQSLR